VAVYMPTDKTYNGIDTNPDVLSHSVEASLKNDMSKPNFEQEILYVRLGGFGPI